MYVQLLALLREERREREVKVQNLHTHCLPNQLTATTCFLFTLLNVPLSSKIDAAGEVNNKTSI